MTETGHSASVRLALQWGEEWEHECPLRQVGPTFGICDLDDELPPVGTNCCVELALIPFQAPAEEAKENANG